jgi:hypothetical protein
MPQILAPIEHVVVVMLGLTDPVSDFGVRGQFADEGADGTPGREAVTTRSEHRCAF